MLLKQGSKGSEVKKLQESLGLTADGIFGAGTKLAVIKFQKKNKLVADGIVGSSTWEVIGIDTDQEAAVEDSEYTTKNGLVIDREYLDKDQYVRDYGKIEPLGFFIHHTAGWDNPYKTITHKGGHMHREALALHIDGGQACL